VREIGTLKRQRERERERAARINLVGEGCGSTNGDRGIFLFYTYIGLV